MKSPFVMLGAALVLSGATAIGQEPGDAAPNRVVWLFELQFGDAGSWSCSRRSTSEASEETGNVGLGLLPKLSPAGRENACLACTSSGGGTGEVEITRAPDGTSETLTSLSRVEICNDVVFLTGTPGETMSRGVAARANTPSATTPSATTPSVTTPSATTVPAAATPTPGAEDVE